MGKECEICGKSEGRVIASKKYNKTLCYKHYGQFERNGHALDYTIYEKNEILDCDDSAKIILKNRYGEIMGESIIDSSDKERVSNHKWHLKKGDNYTSTEMKGKTVLLHRFIMNAKDNEVVDHKDRNRLNNKKINLRVTDMSGNAKNRGLRTDNSSGVIGVYWRKDIGKWTAYIFYKKHIHLGSFVNIDNAIKSRLNAEKMYFNDFAPQKHLFDEYGIGGVFNG